MGILAVALGLALVPVVILFWLGWWVEGIGEKKRIEVEAQKWLDKWREEYYARHRQVEERTRR